MEHLKRIRFLAANYASLQGLKAVAIGVCFLLVSLWSNFQRGPAVNLAFPLSCVLICLVGYFLAEKYYQHTFGKAKADKRARQLEVGFGLVFALLALGAFWVDSRELFPISLLGIVLMLGVISDYLRMNWAAKSRFLLIYPVMAFVILAISLLPLFSDLYWWRQLGIRSMIVGISVVISILMIVNGIASHIFLINAFKSISEVDNGESV